MNESLSFESYTFVSSLTVSWLTTVLGIIPAKRQSLENEPFSAAMKLGF